MNAPLTKEELKAARVAAKAAAVAEKARLTKELDASVQAAQDAMKLPPGISEAGIIRTRSWVTMHAKLSHQLKLKKPKIDKVLAITGLLLEWPRASADDCQRSITRLTSK